MGLARMARAVKQVAQAPDGGVLVSYCGFSQLARIGLRTYVFDDLCNPIDAGSFVKIASTIQQGQFNTCYLRKTCIAFHRVQPFGTVGISERGWNL